LIKKIAVIFTASVRTCNTAEVSEDSEVMLLNIM